MSKIQVPGTVDCVYPMPTESSTIESVINAVTDAIVEVTFTVGAIYIGNDLVRNYEQTITGTFYNTMSGKWFIQAHDRYRLPETVDSGATFEGLIDRLKEYARGNHGVSVSFHYYEGVGRATRLVGSKTIALTVVV